MILRGESGIGKWTVIVKDTVANEFNGTFVDWHLKLFGESIDPSKATLLPMPTEKDDDNHDEEVATTTVAGETTSVTAAPSKTFLSVKPSDHPERPTKPGSPSTTLNQQASATPTQSSIPEASSTSTNSTWLPSFLPTFGVSSKTQIWIYGAAALILVFCGALGVYLFLARRKRLRNNPREEWEFDLIQDDEAEGLTSGGAAGAGTRGKAKSRGIVRCIRSRK
jgi:kexin